MDYRIEIIDTTDALEPLVLQYAERDSISLEWLGGDEKTQAIIGSQLSFTLEVNDARDAAYEYYFTSNEKRFTTTMYVDSTDEVVWNGFLLPESYSEPWRGGIFYVQFDATDGLGLLKGKRLSEDYYRDEKNVIDILCAILSLTEIEIPLYFSPAIINYSESRWDKIWFDTFNLKDKDKNPSAYDVLEELLESMRCQIYQADNRWYIEGYNKRQLLSLNYDVYDLSANYQNTVNIERNVKILTYLPTPTISMLPAVGTVVVNYEKEGLDTGTSLYKEGKDVIDITPSNVQPWWFHNLWTIEDHQTYNLRFANKKLFIQSLGLSAFDATKFIELKEPIYVDKDWTVNFKLKVKNLFASFADDSELTQALINGWSEKFVYEILLNDVVIHTNLNASNNSEEKFGYDNNGEAEVDYSLDIEENGLLNIKLFTPYSSDSLFGNIVIDNLQLSRDDDVQDEVVTIINNADASREDEIDLQIADDNSLVNKAFYLAQQTDILPATAGNLNRFWFEIIEYVTHDGQIYASVPAKVAVLADRYGIYENTVMHAQNGTQALGNFLNDIDVIFNYNGGEQFLIPVSVEFTTGHIMIDARDFKDLTLDRSTWQQWSDAIISVQQNRYSNVVADIQRNLFKDNQYTIEAESDRPVKFNDAISFVYKGIARYFTPTNCSWFPDGNTSSLTMSQMVYDGSGVEVLPPYVDAGPDINISETDTETTVTGIASSPSGTIDIILWTVTASDGSVTIVTPSALQTLVNNLGGNSYTLTLTVTDSNGLTASDSMEINRVTASQLVITQTVDDIDTDIDGEFENVTGRWTIEVDPAIAGNELVNLNFTVKIIGSNNTDQNTNDNFMKCEVIKNTITVYEFTFDTNDLDNGFLNFEALNNIIQLSAGDTLEVELRANADTSPAVTSHDVSSESELIFVSAEIINGTFEIDNLPLSLLASAVASN